MLLVAIILGALLFNVMLAYVPIILIIGYNLRPKKPDDDLRDRYIRDEISTEEYLAEMDKLWSKKTHAPLK